MRTRRTTSLLAAALLVGVAAACTPDGTTPPVPTVTTTSGPIQVTLAVYGPDPVISAYTTIAARFSAKNPSIAINVKPYATHDEAMADLAATRGTKRAPDIFLANQDDLDDLMATKSNQRVDQMLSNRNIDFGDGYERLGMEAFSADSALQCMPVDISPLVVYYNNALVRLSQLRPPGERVPNSDTGWNFDDFTAAAQQASGQRTRGLYVAPTVEQIAPFLFSDGGNVVDDTEKPTQLTLSKGGSKDALLKLLELVRDPALTWTSAQLARRDAVSRFKAGQLGMILGFRNLTPELRNQEGLSFGVMPMPRIGRSATVNDISGLCVKPQLPHRTSTASFLAYLVGDEAQRILARTGFVTPANVSALRSEDFTQPAEDPSGSDVFTTQIRYGKPLPDGDTWEQAEKATDNQLYRLFNDAVIDPVDDRLTAIDDATQSILSGATESPSPSGSTSPSASPAS